MGEYYQRASLAARRLAKSLYDSPVPKGVNPVVWLMKVAVEPHLEAWEASGVRDRVVFELHDQLGRDHMSDPEAWAMVLGYLNHWEEGRDLLKEVIDREQIVLKVNRKDLAEQLVNLGGLMRSEAPSIDLG